MMIRRSPSGLEKTPPIATGRPWYFHTNIAPLWPFARAALVHR